MLDWIATFPPVKYDCPVTKVNTIVTQPSAVTNPILRFAMATISIYALVYNIMPYICYVYEVRIKCLHVNTGYLEFESMYFVLVLAKIPWL